MFTINYYIRKKTEISTDAFNAYWLSEHADLLRDFVEKIGVRAVLKNEPLPEHPTTRELTALFETGGDLFDFIDQWIFNDIEELKEGSRDPEVQAAMQKLFASEDQYIDTARCQIFMGQEIAQTYPRNPIRANPGSDYIKLFYLAEFHEHLPLKGIQLHMNACHGAMSRLSAEFSMFTKYVQQFRIESTFVNELIAERGYILKPNFAGHAELMINTVESPVAADIDEEAAAEESAMSLEDFEIFVDKPNAQCFVSHEHYIVDRKIYTRTRDGKMPVFFSAEY